MWALGDRNTDDPAGKYPSWKVGWGGKVYHWNQFTLIGVAVVEGLPSAVSMTGYKNNYQFVTFLLLCARFNIRFKLLPLKYP